MLAEGLAMPQPPTGTVTFLFTDIQGSTHLWERAPDAMRPALARHDILLRHIRVEAHDGDFGARAVKIRGDPAAPLADRNQTDGPRRGRLHLAQRHVISDK
jgi:class 3 adenylate cyclase